MGSLPRGTLKKMRHSTSRSLYRYWNEVRGDRIAPRRFEIEPSRISELLPETFILEAVNDETLRYRLAGTRLSGQFRRDFRGANFLDQWDRHERASISSKLETVMASGFPAVIISEASCARGRKAVFESILLPLIHTKGIIDRILGASSCISPPAWVGEEALVRQKLIDARIVYPGANPDQSAASKPIEIVRELEPQPFLAHVRNARIVRQDQRQFRVYDGGLLTRETES